MAIWYVVGTVIAEGKNEKIVSYASTTKFDLYLGGSWPVGLGQVVKKIPMEKANQNMVSTRFQPPLCRQKLRQSNFYYRYYTTWFCPDIRFPGIFTLKMECYS